MSDPREIEKIFAEGIELRNPAERAEYLARACGGDAELRREVESLLAAHEQASAFLEEHPTMVSDGQDPAKIAAQESEGTRIGRYKLLEKIGEGGFGDVWMAEQEAPMRRRVALKIIKLGMDTKEVIARFEAERQALALMDHPNIARVFDGGATELGRPYFVMELVKGLPITQFCDGARMSNRDRLELFMQVCGAVQHAHQKGIIHRDLKPSNVLVTVQDDKPVPKVIDFGIAKATQTRLTDQTLFTRFQQLVGTPAYMSPEQAGLGSQDIDTRSDVYSLGVLLYELLVGKPPFTKEELFNAGFEEMRRVIREKDPPRPSTRVSTLTVEELAAAARNRNSAPARLHGAIRGELDWIVLKALEKDRSRRYDSAGAFGQDIANFIKNEPVRACAPTATYQFKKFVQRHRTALGTASAFVILLVAASIFSGWQAVRANRHAREAARQGRAVRETFSQSDFIVAGQLLERERPDLAAAYLARALRSNPTNYVAAAKLLCTLAFYKFTPLLLPPLEHEGVVWTISVSTNGRRAVTLSRDWTASLWDLATGERIRPNSTGGVFKAAITPDGGTMILSMTNTIAWNVATPLAEARSFRGEFGCLSPDGAKLLTTQSEWSQTNRIQKWTFNLWNFASGERIGEAISLTSSVYEFQAATSRDGNQLAIALDDKVHLWRVGANLAAGPVIATGTRLTVLTMDPEGKRVITGCGQHEAAGIGYARVWSVETGEPITPELKHTASIGSALFSPDGTKVATASWDNTARVWDARTGEPLTHPLQHDFRVYAAHFSPDGSTVATAGEDQSIRIWDARSGKPVGAPLKHEQTGGIPAIAYTPDGSRLISASGDFTARVWNLATKRADGLVLGTNELGSKSMTSDGRTVLAADTNGVVHVFDSFSGLETRPGLAHTGRVEALAITPDNRFAVTCGSDRKVRTWDLASQRLAAVSSNEIAGRLNPAGLVISPDATVAVTTSADGCQIWEIATGREIAPPVPRGYWAVISPDSSKLIATAPSEGVRVWELRTGRMVRSIPQDWRSPEHIAISRDNKSLAIGSHAQARVVDIETGALIAPKIRHRGDVTAIGFTPDGTRLITACMGGVVRVLDVKTGQDTIPELRLPSPAVAFALNGNGSRIVTGGETGHMRVWDMATGEPLTPFFEDEHVPWLSPPDVISLDGCAVVTSSMRLPNAWRAAVWRLPQEEPRLPGWFLRFAESLANARLNDLGILERVRPEEYFSNVAELQRMNASDENVRFAKWLIGENAGQVSPFAFRNRVD